MKRKIALSVGFILATIISHEAYLLSYHLTHPPIASKEMCVTDDLRILSCDTPEEIAYPDRAGNK